MAGIKNGRSHRMRTDDLQKSFETIKYAKSKIVNKRAWATRLLVEYMKTLENGKDVIRAYYDSFYDWEKSKMLSFIKDRKNENR